MKLSKDELKILIDKRKIDLLRLNVPLDINSEYYSIDSILLTLYGERWNTPKSYLRDRQKDFEGLSKVDGNCTSKIRSIKNYNVLIINIDSQDRGSYFFYSVSRQNNAVLNGSLFYFKSSSDKVKALKVIEELLDNIAYKL